MPPLVAFALGGPEILFGAVSLFVALPLFAFWIWMLVDCLTQEQDPNQKLVWVIVIVFVGLIGAPLYFILRWFPRRRPPPPSLS